MALVDLNRGIHRATITFERFVSIKLLDSGKITFRVSDEHGKMLYMVLAAQFMTLDDGKDWIVPKVYPEKLVELIMRNPSEARVGYLVDEEFLCAEPIQFSPQLLKMACDPININVQLVKLPQKLAKVAVFTQAYNEGDMLLYWEDYYAKLVGHENLYVLNNASTDGSCARLDKRTSVINMPPGPVDHVHFAQSHGYFLRFLLLKYDWVIKVDADELLACEDGLVETLARTPSGIYRPEQAVEVVHDMAREPSFDFSSSVGAQRGTFVKGTELLLRPIICGKPASWTAGNHLAHEFNSVLPGFVVAHLKYFDFDFLSKKNNKWSRMEPTENELTVCNQISYLRELDETKLHELSLKEINDRLAEERVPVPAWLPGKL